MVTSHFITKWRKRMEEQTTIPKNLLNQLMIKCYKMVESNIYENELVVVEDLNRYGFNLYENQLCVIIRGGKLVTVFRRNENSPKTTYGSRVENVRYGYGTV